MTLGRWTWWPAVAVELDHRAPPSVDMLFILLPTVSSPPSLSPNLLLRDQLCNPVARAPLRASSSTIIHPSTSRITGLDRARRSRHVLLLPTNRDATHVRRVVGTNNPRLLGAPDPDRDLCHHWPRRLDLEGAARPRRRRARRPARSPAAAGLWGRWSWRDFLRARRAASTGRAVSTRWPSAGRVPSGRVSTRRLPRRPAAVARRRGPGSRGAHVRRAAAHAEPAAILRRSESARHRRHCSGRRGRRRRADIHQRGEERLRGSLAVVRGGLRAGGARGARQRPRRARLGEIRERRRGAQRRRQAQDGRGRRVRRAAGPRAGRRRRSVPPGARGALDPRESRRHR